jgi:hypothetical protein
VLGRFATLLCLFSVSDTQIPFMIALNTNKWRKSQYSVSDILGLSNEYDFLCVGGFTDRSGRAIQASGVGQKREIPYYSYRYIDIK